MKLRSKLIWLFISIKVLPLILLAWLAWFHAGQLGETLSEHYQDFESVAKASLQTVGDQSVVDSMAALEDRARSEIERLTTDTAKQIAHFLYARDDDIRLAAVQLPSRASYTQFLQHRNAIVPKPLTWQFDEPSGEWLVLEDRPKASQHEYQVLPDNSRAHHRRAPEVNSRKRAPLYHEMTFVSLEGKELIKITTSDLMAPQLRDISQRENTFVGAESYFAELGKLKAGEVYVSEVIGEYVPTDFIGTYSPHRALKEGLEFDPQNSAYAGKENPLGKRFRGIIRWATPVLSNAAGDAGETEIIGYVTLALNHDHIMNMTDAIMPTDKRYTTYADPSEGNYAFIWDHVGRNIAHPRHYFIAGYNGQTGHPEIPWLEQHIYDQWQQSGMPFHDYVKQAPLFAKQSLTNKPAQQLAATGLRGLDCRFLNFAPQCRGWYALTEQGGSGSFIIYWSGLWKLVTAAPIPYFSGLYGASKRGFGIVTIGTNIDEFFAPARLSESKLELLTKETGARIAQQAQSGLDVIRLTLVRTSESIGYSTLIMIILVVLIAIWVASYFSNRIVTLVRGMAHFRRQNRRFRFNTQKGDEISALASAFDQMADTVDDQVTQLEHEVELRRNSEHQLVEMKNNLEVKVLERTKELTLEIERRKVIQEQAKYLAEHDELTKLPNRRAFGQKFNAILASAEGQQDKVALLLIDLDRFKEVNDNFGHDVGDKLLCFIADLLLDTTRENDNVARLGGDEFAIIMSSIESTDVVDNIVNRIIHSLQSPVIIDGHQIQSGVSVGISMYPDNSSDAEELLKQADLALYQVKSMGGLHYLQFDRELKNKSEQQEAVEKQIVAALDKQLLDLHYQPIFNYVSGKVEGVEALMRLQINHQQTLLPHEFLDIADRSGMGQKLETWLVQQVCKQALHWRQQGIAFGHISFNVGVKELCKAGFAQSLCDTIELMGVAASDLAIEVMERQAISDFRYFNENIMQLRAKGIAIYLDDIGTEHSSLQRMLENQVDAIKIDRFFIQEVGKNSAESIIKALINIGADNGVAVIAEGVETQAQLDFLLAHDCAIVQGFIQAPPMPTHKLEAYLASRDVRDC